MDDTGQRLLDVIDDNHALESFLRENFPSTGLESPRLDNHSSPSLPNSNSNLNSCTNSSLLNSSNALNGVNGSSANVLDNAFDSLVFDGGSLSLPTSNRPINSTSTSVQSAKHSVYSGGGIGNVFSGANLSCSEMQSLSDSLNLSSCVSDDKGKGGELLIESSSGGDQTSSLQQLLAPSASQAFPPFVLDTSTSNVYNTNKNNNTLGHQQTNINITNLLGSSQQNVSFNNSITSNHSINSLSSANFITDQSPKATSLSKINSNNKIQNQASPSHQNSLANHNNNISNYTNIGGFSHNVASNSTNINNISNIAPNIQIVNNQFLPSTTNSQVIGTSTNNSLISNSSTFLNNGQVVSGTRFINSSGAQLLPQTLVNSSNNGYVNASMINQQAVSSQNTIQLQNSIPEHNALLPSSTKGSGVTTKVTTQVSHNYSNSSKVSGSKSVANILPTANSVAQSSNIMIQQLPMMGGNVILGNAQQNNLKPIIQTPNGQFIQLVGNNRVPTVVSTTPKLIQPKQPQLLPKPISSVNAVSVSSQINLTNSKTSTVITRPVATATANAVSTAALQTSAGHHQPTLLALPVSNQSSLGNHSAPTVLTSGANNTAPANGGLIFNGNMMSGGLQGLQSGLQQPVLVQHPNGMQLLLKPTGPSPFIFNQPQFLINPSPNVQSSNVANSNTKNNPQPAPSLPPQAIMIPGANGQPPTFVVPQGMTQGLVTAQNLTGTPNIVGATNNRNIAPSNNPIYRILPQQPPTLQLQQINTPSGPQFIVVPSNTSTLNLPTGVLGGAMRQLAPQLQTPTIQIGQQIQVPGQPALQMTPSVSVGSSVFIPQSNLNLSSSSAAVSTNANNDVNTLTNTTQCITPSIPSIISSNNTLVQQNKNIQIQQHQPDQKKKKSKKKKKEPKSPLKRSLINLNDLLKQTGILGESFSEDHDLASLTVEDDLDAQVPGCSSSADNVSSNLNPTINLDNNFSIANPATSFSIMPYTSNGTTTTAQPNNIFITTNINPDNNIPQSSHSAYNMLGIPSVSNMIANSSNQTVNSVATIGQQPNNLIQPNLVNITGGLAPQVIGNKLNQAPLASNLVATIDAQGKLVFSSLGPVKNNAQIMPSTSSAPLIQTSNGLFVNYPTLQIQSAADTATTVTTLASSSQPVNNNSSITTRIVNSSKSITTNANTFSPKLGPIIMGAASQASFSVDYSSGRSTNSNVSPKVKKTVGADISKVVQNTQLFKSLQPEIITNKITSNNISTNSNIPMNTLNQEGSVIIGCQSFQPTSTGYGFTKSQIVPVNSIIPNSQSFSSVASSAVTISTNSVIAPHTITSPSTNSNPKADNINSFNSVRSPPHSLSKTNSSAKPKRSRSKKKKVEDGSHNELLSPPIFNVVQQRKASPDRRNAPKVDISPVMSTNATPKLSYLSNGFSNVPPIAKNNNVKLLQSSSASNLMMLNNTVNSSSSGPPAPLVNFVHSSNAVSTPLMSIASSSSITVSSTNSSNTVTSSPLVNMVSSSNAISAPLTPPINNTPRNVVKQLIITPSSHETLTKVIAELQPLQNKKDLNEREKQTFSRLMAEYTKIIEGGTLVKPNTIINSSVSCPVSQSLPARYSHPVGHKVFQVNPKNKITSPTKEMSSKELRTILPHKKDSPIVSKSSSTSKSIPSCTNSPLDNDVSIIYSSNSSKSYSSSAHFTPPYTPSPNSVACSTATVCSSSQVSAPPPIERSALESTPMSCVAPISPRVTVTSASFCRKSSNDANTFTSKNQQLSNFITPPPSNSPVVTNTPPSSLSLPPINGFTSQENSIEYGVLKPNNIVGVPQTSPITPTSPQPPTSFSCRMVQHQPPNKVSVPISSPAAVNAVYGPRDMPLQTTYSQPTMVSTASPSPTYSTGITQEKLFELQLSTDQKGALNPDYKTPFKSHLDTCKRLIRYHVLSDKGPTPKDIDERDSMFENQGESLLKKFMGMKYKYQSLLLKDSMRRHPTAEVVMLYRMHLQEEKNKFEKEKSMVESGRADMVEWLRPKDKSEKTPLKDSLYPWEDEWEEQKVYTFAPPVYDEQPKAEEEDILMENFLKNTEPDLMFRGVKSREGNISPLTSSSREEVNTPSGGLYCREDLHTPCGSNFNSYDRASPSVERPIAPAKTEENFSDRIKKTHKIQEELYDKLLANTVISPNNTIVKCQKETSDVETQPKIMNEEHKPPTLPIEEEEVLDDPDPPVLLIMEESESEEPVKEEEEVVGSPDHSPDRFRDARGFTRRESIVYRHSTTDDSDEEQPVLRVVTDGAASGGSLSPASPSKLLQKSLTNPVLESRFEVLCKPNGIDRRHGVKRLSDEDSPPSSKHPKLESKELKKSNKESKKQRSKKSDRKSSERGVSPNYIPPLIIKTDDKVPAGGLKLTLKKQSSGDFKSTIREKINANQYVITNRSAGLSQKNGVVEQACAPPMVPNVGEMLKKRKPKDEENASSSRKKSKKNTKSDKYRLGDHSLSGQHPYSAGILPYAEHHNYKNSEWFSGANLYHQHAAASQSLHTLHHIPASLHPAALHRGAVNALPAPHLHATGPLVYPRVSVERFQHQAGLYQPPSNHPHNYY